MWQLRNGGVVVLFFFPLSALCSYAKGSTFMSTTAQATSALAEMPKQHLRKASKNEIE